MSSPLYLLSSSKLASILLCLLSLGLAAADAPAAGPASERTPPIRTDIEYGRAGGEALLLDACVPDGAGPFPAVLLVHGGAWTSGDKSGGPKKAFIAPLHAPLSQAGFAWFSINYRLAPKHRYPAAVEDVETAVRWLRSHAAEFRVDPRRIALAGESAGAHLVALAAVRPDSEASRTAAIIPFYGPFDLPARVQPGQSLGSMAAFFGVESATPEALRLLAEASPALHVRPGLPPFLLVHGTADTRVPYAQSTGMQAKLRQAGVPCDLITVPGGPHGMGGWKKLGSDYQDQVVAWLRRTLAP